MDSIIRADVLAKLLRIHETLDVLPDYPTIADFLQRALGEIPGVLHMHLYVEGVVFPSFQLLEEICTESKTAGDTSSENIGRGGDNSLIVTTPLQSARQKYGKLILCLYDKEAFSPYLAFVQNIANALVATLETREHIRHLDENKIGLEAKIAESTAALKNLNEALEQRVWEETEKNRQKDAMLIQQSRLAAMGEMIGNIAHQWRQPLNALGLILANIKDAADYKELTPEYLESLVRDGERLIQKMSTTIDDFRHFFRPQKRAEPFNLSTAIKEALSLVEASFRNNNIEFKLELEEDILIVGFANEFSQVLINLLNNAQDAILSRHSPNGSVTVRLCRDALLAVVTVTDNGGGIPPAVMEKIFEPYFSTKRMGTGIGLYMSKMIIEKSMRGTLGVRNVDCGAEFTLSLPSDNVIHPEHLHVHNSPSY
ncbi:MAG: hypothetical protein DM484_07605 [Candidatus Methylumidiphilus alinenensis]|uniref:histidine kinase n=1 Tax=Candidatus Methylumidiphilus alinenensis TaxID=2202197 RepID=A0A2W4RJA3_9GAMM|nr:MAG: hypothetical protein DM484_07605 [Candidatus Methylumidiphilus alinenensis]